MEQSVSTAIGLQFQLNNIIFSSFFRARGTELALYKGRAALTGPRRGTIDMRIPLTDGDEYSSESGSSVDYSDGEDEVLQGQPSGLYGGMPISSGHAQEFARRRQLDQRRERKRRERERGSRRNRGANYTLFVFSVQS